MASAGLSASVVQVNVLIVNISPAGRTMEAGKLTIWIAIESARTPPTWRSTIDEIWSAVHRGYTYDGRLIGRGA
jgi:hypothetical protein